MKVNSGQAPSTLIHEYIGSSFDAVLEVASNIEAVKVVAENVDTFGVPLASETTTGIAEIATQAEVNQKTNDSHIVTPKKLGAYAAPLVHNHATATSTESGFLAATDKHKLDGIDSNANNYIHPTTDGNLHVPATGVDNNGKLLRAGDIAGSLVWDTISKTDVGLPNVDNTSDLDKPISTTTQIALDGKSAINHTHNYLPLTGGTLTDDLQGTTFIGALAGNASTATSADKLIAARTISLTGDVIGSVSFDGSTDVTFVASCKSSGVAAGTYKSVTVDEKGHITAGTNPTTLVEYGITDAVLSSDVVTTATASKILKLNANSKLPASITGNADGNAATATKLATARTINGVSFDGSANITINAVDSTSRIASSEKGVANGVATLGADGKISSSQLPSYTAGAVDSVAGKTGVVTLVKADVGLSDVDNTSDINKPISTAQQSALDLKANLASPALTGIPSAPTAMVGTSTTQIATTAFVNAEIANDAAPSSHVGATGTAHGIATTSVAGFMSAADKTKLDSISGANTGDQTITLTGDVTGSGTGSFATMLANSGVTTGTYKSVTVDAKGRVTAGTNPTTLAGYGITDALGISDNAVSASKWATARTLTFTGGSTGTGSIDGSNDVSIVMTVPPTGHVHALSTISGSPYKEVVDAATTVALTVTATATTLTNSGTLATLVLDGVTCTSGMRVLVKNQTNSAQNGIYTVTNMGSTSVAWVLTRSADADTSAELAGTVVIVVQGTTNGGKLCTTHFKKTDTIGTAPVLWVEVVDSGNFLTIHPTSGIAAGTYRSITFNNRGHATAGSNPTTLAGYGITDAVANTTTINGKALTANIILTATDVGAQPATSDIRVKSNIESLAPVLDKVMLIDPKTFTMEGREGTCVGTIAQDWEVDFPEVILNVSSTSQGEPEMLKGIDALGTIGILLKAIQELKGEIEDLKNR